MSNHTIDQYSEAPSFPERTGIPIRDSVISSVAQHSTSSDIEPIVNGAREQRDNEIRTSRASMGRFEAEADTKANRTKTIREQVREGYLTAARGPQPERKSAEIKPGPPAAMDSKAKGRFHDLSTEDQLAVKRLEAGYETAVKNDLAPHFEQYSKIDKILAPHRENYRSLGLSDDQALSSLLGWESLIRNPATRVQALHDLARQYGTDLREIVGTAPQQQQSDPQTLAAANRQVDDFRRNHPDFAAHSETMGKLIAAAGDRYVNSNGSVDLEAVYRDARRFSGTAPNVEAKQRAAISPRGRSPVGNSDNSRNKTGGVAGSLRAAFAQHRGGV